MTAKPTLPFAAMLVSAGALLAACGAPATATPDEQDQAAAPAETASNVEAATADVAEQASDAVTAEAAEAGGAEMVEADAEAEDHGDHDHDADHDHGEDGDHDHDHDHAGGEAHVHGAADAAIALDGDTLTVSFTTPLASLGLSEAKPADAAAEAALMEALAPFDTAATVVNLPAGAGCTAESADVATDFDGSHGSMAADYTFTCTDTGAIDEASFPLFADYPTLETVEVAWLVGTDQTSKTLTPGDTVIAP